MGIPQTYIKHNIFLMGNIVICIQSRISARIKSIKGTQCFPSLCYFIQQSKFVPKRITKSIQTHKTYRRNKYKYNITNIFIYKLRVANNICIICINDFRVSFVFNLSKLMYVNYTADNEYCNENYYKIIQYRLYSP